MRDRRRRAVRAAVLGVFGVLALAPGAQAATCIHTGGLNGTATLTFAAGDGADALTGGKGADYLDGGGGDDTARRVGAGDRVTSCRIA